MAIIFIGINGSPRKYSNTRFLLEKALHAAVDLGAQATIIDTAATLDQLDAPFCVHCSSPCKQQCYRGTQLEQDYKLISQADGIILASPVYFGTVSAQLKAYWDMSRALRSRECLLNTIGGAIAVGASRFGGQETTIRTLHDMMLIQGMTLVGNGMQGVQVGHQGVCAQQETFHDAEAIADAESLGKRIYYTIMHTK